MARINLGNQALGTTNVQFPPANNKAACRFQNTYAYPITITTFRGKWGSSYASAKVKAVIYSDNAAAPDALLGSSDEKVGITAGWNALTFSTPVVVAAGAYVWIGVIADTMMQVSQCLNTGAVRYNADTYSDGPSATFGSSSSTTATYPMWVEGDDGELRFGRASVDSGSGNYQPEREHGEPFVLGGTVDVDVTSISTYIKTTSATVKSKAAIFTDSSGLPGTKVAQTVEVTGSTASSWLTLNFSSPVRLSPGTYWLCFIADTNLETPVIPQGGLLRADGTQVESTAWSSSITFTDNVAPFGIDIYASYTTVISGTLAATESGGDTASFAGSATGAITGTLAATESGSDTAALAGDVYVAGSVAATESGADSASLNGTVLVVGALSATESGADTAALTGVASGVITGTLAATESGADAASVAGTVLVAGSFAATESGADVAALSGDVVVSGSLAAVESGADTAAASGDVLVQGALATTEAGADTASLAAIAIASGALSAAEAGADSAAASGVVLVRGTLGASEAADVAALSGVIVVRGALAVTEQGADVAAIAGDVLAQGALAATETGSDTAAFVGDATPESIGALAATETGSDSASATGVVRVRGSAAITETGADSAIVVGKVFIAGTVAASEAEDTAAINGVVVAPTISHLVARIALRPSLAAGIGSDTAVSARSEIAPHVSARHRIN